MCMPRRCHFALDAMDHFILVYMLSTLHVPGMCYLIFLPVMHTRTAIQACHCDSFPEIIAGYPSRCHVECIRPRMQLYYRHHLCS